MAIHDLPEAGEEILEPIYDQQITNITSLVLNNNATENKLCGDLTESVSNLSSSVRDFNVKDDEIQRVRDHVDSTPVGTTPEFTADYKQKLLNGLDSVFNFNNKMKSAVSQVQRFTDHGNVMVQNVTALSSVINNAISLPSQLTTDIIGGLPSSFPSKIPSFKLGLDKLPIPNFSGLNLPSMPKFNISSFSIPGIPDINNLPGISIPGIPNPSDVFKSFSGSIADSSFGGVGKLLSSNMKKYSGVVKSLAGKVSSSISGLTSSITGSIANQFNGSLVSPPPTLPQIPTIAEITDMVDLGSATDAVSGLSGGMSDVIGGENGAMNGVTCSLLLPGGACGGLPSITSSLGTASGLANMAKTTTSSKLLASVATPALAKQFKDTIKDKIKDKVKDAIPIP